MTIDTRLENNKRPDIRIEGRDLLIYIEVKVESPADEDQLSSYKKELEKSDEKYKLILLTKYLEDVDSKLGVTQIHWYEVATWFTEFLAKQEDPLTKYVVNQFLDFLKERNMTMEKITEEYIAGIKSLANLLSMLEVCLKSIKCKPSKGGKGAGHAGRLFHDGKLFFGIYYSQPESLAISILEKPMGGISDADYAKYQKRLGNNTFKKNNYGNYQNTFSLTDSDFFSKEKKDQISILTEFLRKTYEAVRQINPEILNNTKSSSE